MEKEENQNNTSVDQNQDKKVKLKKLMKIQILKIIMKPKKN